ncbi:hypothetical protein PMAYCL1PPCAC_14061, partial [Pristionchus mayeri]
FSQMIANDEDQAYAESLENFMREARLEEFTTNLVDKEGVAACPYNRQSEEEAGTHERMVEVDRAYDDAVSSFITERLLEERRLVQEHIGKEIQGVELTPEDMTDSKAYEEYLKALGAKIAEDKHKLMQQVQEEKWKRTGKRTPPLLPTQIWT